MSHHSTLQSSSVLLLLVGNCSGVQMIPSPFLLFSCYLSCVFFLFFFFFLFFRSSDCSAKVAILKNYRICLVYMGKQITVGLVWLLFACITFSKNIKTEKKMTNDSQVLLT